MEVTDWLLDGDPAIRWQVLRDLIHASTLSTLMLLRNLGLDPASPAARETISLVAANCRWEHDGQAFFDGEVEACNNGRTLSIGAYFDADVDGLVTGLLDDQLEDGGWNCWTAGRHRVDVRLDDLRARGPAPPETPGSRMSDHVWVNEASRAENEPMPSEAKDFGPFFHGAKADLQPGDLLEPGYGSNFGERRQANYIYLTATLDAAPWGAELAAGEGPGRIYRVGLAGPFEDDPNLTDTGQGNRTAVRAERPAPSAA